MRLEVEPHYQISSSTTPQLSSDTIRASRSLWTSSTESRTSNGNGLSWRPLSTSGNLGLESPIDASMTPTTKSQGISSPVKPPAKSSLTGMRTSESSGLMSSAELPFRFHSFSGSVTSGTTGWRPREVQLLCLDFGRSSYPPQRIRLVGGGIALSISRTPDSFGEDLPKYTISQESLDTTASPFLLNGQKDLTTQSPQRLTQRQPTRSSEEKPKEEEQKPWSWPENSDEEMAWIEPVSLSDLPNPMEMDLEDLPPLPDLSQICLDQTTMDGLTPSTDSDSEESIILPRNWYNVC